MNYSQYQLVSLTVLRVLIGWHFLYEGISKLISPYWSSAAYLLDSKWLLSGVATTIVSNPTLLSFSDYINMWGLTAVGALLMLGLFSRYATVAGLVLVLLYYFFAPPFTGLEYSKPAEGSYLIVNKNLIEACALWVLYMFPSSDIIGLDRFFKEQINKGDEHE
ncbi:MAG TPA: DoxX family protein [Candidatus Marinimicrobia bacterium]|jgi:thiosulfate dehydrogenase [quinone] large subunit|nr:DoxX family protein [Candidatus Neomarinimicrobiota bacterium]HIB60767.1 DoxX family protein [Candidatus Neomarinimicrobiota bacterium]